jgi:hypothetical protein
VSSVAHCISSETVIQGSNQVCGSSHGEWGERRIGLFARLLEQPGFSIAIGRMSASCQCNTVESSATLLQEMIKLDIDDGRTPHSWLGTEVACLNSTLNIGFSIGKSYSHFFTVANCTLSRAHRLKLTHTILSRAYSSYAPPTNRPRVRLTHHAQNSSPERANVSLPLRCARVRQLHEHGILGEYSSRSHI